MSNAEFIHKYGKREFYALTKDIYNILMIWKINKKIKYFKCSNRKKQAILYLNNGTSKYLDYATIATNDKCNIL